MASLPRPPRPAAAGLLTLLLVSLAAVVPATPASAGTEIRGLDVSKWQGDVDWETVAASGESFVIIRATKGTDEKDPTFFANQNGATEAGMTVGAYHRATPSAEPGDAAAEARFYLRRTRQDPGDVIPALDIEETGGLSVPALREWVKTWLTRVRDRLGVRPMIYTSPNFWRTNLGDTTWFANHGYALWIANWGVPQPQEIAEDWSGQGWTYWQHDVDPAGSVPGISTAIDRDVFIGSDLLDGTIASLEVTPATGGKITGRRIACGGFKTRCSRLANPNEVVTLTATPDEATTLIGWTGACEASGTSPTCDVTVRGTVGVSAVFQPAVVLPEDADGTAFRWGARADAGAVGGAYRLERRAGASMTFDVTGSRVVLRILEGPSVGRARVDVDGAKAAVLDGWAREPGFDMRELAGLGAGPHELTITALGTKRERSLGTRVGLDAMRWGGSLRADPEPTDAGWGPIEAVEATDGTAVVTDVAGARATLRFTGTGVTWISAEGPGMGRAEVWIDGELVETAGLYATSPAWGIEHTYVGLTDTEHVLRIAVDDRANVASSGHDVVIDGWIMR